jgi:hypothetical protein
VNTTGRGAGGRDSLCARNGIGCDDRFTAPVRALCENAPPREVHLSAPKTVTITLKGVVIQDVQLPPGVRVGGRGVRPLFVGTVGELARQQFARPQQEHHVGVLGRQNGFTRLFVYWRCLVTFPSAALPPRLSSRRNVGLRLRTVPDLDARPTGRHATCRVLRSNLAGACGGLLG